MVVSLLILAIIVIVFVVKNYRIRGVLSLILVGMYFYQTMAHPIDWWTLGNGLGAVAWLILGISYLGEST